MTPTEKYQQDLAAGKISADAEQRRIIGQLEQLYLALEQGQARPGGLLAGVRRLWRQQKGTESVRGMYLWGGVGRGKTYLMDVFYESLQTTPRMRTHFHRFMQSVHQGLGRYQGQKNPLQRIADDIAGQARVLCFDEFFVLDIGDAMILAGLLEALFERELVLVTTSNIYPDGLYENGLQRERFLPAIALIKAHCNVLEIAQGTDYRLRSLTQARLYHSPITGETDAILQESFTRVAPDTSDLQSDCRIEILGREIPVRQCAGDVAWFDYAVLCDSPRSAFDYVEISRLFHAIIISDVPALTDRQNDQARRFINLVDALYDHQVKLIISAQVPLDALYSGESLAFEFERTHSRLVEMQSEEYLGSGHRG